MRETAKTIGNRGEDLAVKYLSSKGFNILERNFRTSRGEIDIIARDNEFLVFVEVKNYAAGNLLTPESSLTYKKRKKLLYTAQTYLCSHGYHEFNCRFDLLAIKKNKTNKYLVEHIENAFS